MFTTLDLLHARDLNQYDVLIDNSRWCCMYFLLQISCCKISEEGFFLTDLFCQNGGPFGWRMGFTKAIQPFHISTIYGRSQPFMATFRGSR